MLSRGAVSSPHCGRLLRAAVPLGRWRRPHDRRVPERRARQTDASYCLKPPRYALLRIGDLRIVLESDKGFQELFPCESGTKF